MDTTTTESKRSSLINAIALAQDAAQNAEDRGNLAKTNKIKAQIRAMEAELAQLSG
jgi:hypothetical protein